jgi:hypothetical protein
MKHKKYVIAVVGILLVVLAGVVYLFAVKKESSQPEARASERKVILVNTDMLVGGPCSFYVTDKDGKPQDECVDEGDVDTVLETYGLKMKGVRVINTATKELVKIDADMHIEVEKRTPSTPKPQYRNKNVYHLDKVYSAELVK